MANTYVMVKMSKEMKEHVATFAATHDETLSGFVRKVLAEETEYDLAADEALDGRGRPAKYKSDAERNKAARDRANEKARMERLVRDAVMKQERLEGAEALRQWLIKQGINPDAEDAA